MPLRAGSTYLEIQVAMVMLAIAVSGLYSLSVIQTRQTSRLAEVLPSNEIAALNQADSAWERKLGSYARIESAAAPRPAEIPYVKTTRIVDNQDGSPAVELFRGSNPYDWTSWDYPTNYLGNAHFLYNTGDPSPWAELSAFGLPAGDYDVFVMHPVFTSLGNAIEHQVYDGNSLLESVLVNQQQSPDDTYHAGRWWKRLGTYEINSGTCRVRLIGGPGALWYIIADAIMVRSRRSLEIQSIADTADGGVTVTLEHVP